MGRTVLEALRKAFHGTIKDERAKTIVVKDHKEDFESALEAEDYKIVESSDESYLNESAAVYYNPYSTEADRRLREYAVKRRIVTFTEKESLLAFIKSLAINEFSVTALEDWHTDLREDVKA